MEEQFRCSDSMENSRLLLVMHLHAGCVIPRQKNRRILKQQDRLCFLCSQMTETGHGVSWWSDPVLLGHYPEEGMKRYEAYLPQIMDEDMKLISEPIDVYGQNIYNGRCVRMGADGKPEDVKRYEGFLKTAIDWPVTPEVLYWGPKFLYERYQKPMYITENGIFSGC